MSENDLQNDLQHTNVWGGERVSRLLMRFAIRSFILVTWSIQLCSECELQEKQIRMS